MALVKYKLIGRSKLFRSIRYFKIVFLYFEIDVLNLSLALTYKV